MNLYVIVEGEQSERKVYKKWIQYLNPNLKCVSRSEEIVNNNYIIYSGFGYPFYFEIINSAIEEVNAHGKIDRLVIAVDSDEMSYEEKYCEIESHITNRHCKAQICIIVQHFCLETWALGNKFIISRTPQSEKLREYIKFYDVVENDPELMPAYKREELNRAQFAVRYLKAALNEKNEKLTYSKRNPKVLLNQKYFKRVKNRLETTGHIASFSAFLTAFK